MIMIAISCLNNGKYFHLIENLRKCHDAIKLYEY